MAKLNPIRYRLTERKTNRKQKQNPQTTQGIVLSEISGDYLLGFSQANGKISQHVKRHFARCV